MIDKKKLIVFEGADGLGKSTQVKIFKNDHSDTKVIRQPSEENSLGWLRKELKYSLKDLTMTERQLIHTFQNAIDAYESLGDELVIMDRSYLSTLVYGEAFGVRSEILKLIHKMQLSIWQKATEEYDVYWIIFYSGTNKSFKEADDSIYEQDDKWKIVNELYTLNHSRNRVLFNTDEKVKFIDVDNKNIGKIRSIIKESLEKGGVI